MRIAIITSVHAPLDVRVFQKQGTTLAAAGHDVTLFARERTQVSSSKEIADRGLHFVNLRSGGSRVARVRLWTQIVGHLRRQAADVWHFHDPELLPVLIAARSILRIRVAIVYDVHEDLPKDILEKHWIAPRMRRGVAFVADRVERWGARRCDLVVAATDSIGSRLALSARRSVVVHNYPLAVEDSPADQQSRPVKAIVAGGLSKKRGLIELVEAMRLVRTSDLELHLFGGFLTQDFESELRSRCGANVFIHGEVPFSEIAGHLSSAHIGVVTFLPVPNHVEALPNKLFEYMRAGLAIVASDFPIWRPLVVGTGCGVVVDPANPTEIAFALDRLAQDPAARRAMGEAGTANVRDRYSWSAAASVLLDAYNGLDDS